MSNDNIASDDIPPAASTEEQTEQIEAIVGDEVLGYDRSARGEHSGQESEAEPPKEDRLSDQLADNRPDQMK